MNLRNVLKTFLVDLLRSLGETIALLLVGTMLFAVVIVLLELFRVPL